MEKAKEKLEGHQEIGMGGEQSMGEWRWASQLAWF
jgi:hypothetical protein